MHKNQPTQFALRDALTPKEIETLVSSAKVPFTLEEKLVDYDRRTKEVKVWNRDNTRFDRRSELGTHAYNIFNSLFPLPIVGRRQQIGKAIAFGREFLQENPETGIFKALVAGCAQEYKEWLMLMGDLTEEQQLAILQGRRAKKVDAQNQQPEDEAAGNK